MIEPKHSWACDLKPDRRSHLKGPLNSVLRWMDDHRWNSGSGWRSHVYAWLWHQHARRDWHDPRCRWFPPAPLLPP
jgi:hypothetical protein